jgi:hemerythrin
LFAWNYRYSVGVPEMDAQHRKLIDLLRILYEAVSAGEGEAVVGGVLHDLIEYTQVHFADEERLMALNAYPAYERHRARHAELTAQVLELQRRYEAGELVFGMEVMGFLRRWLLDHIQAEDQHYGPFIPRTPVRSG